MPSGKHVFVSVKPSDTIMEVKQKIEDKEGVATDKQSLKFMGKQLKGKEFLLYM